MHQLLKSERTAIVWLVCLLIAHIVLAAAFATDTPYRQAGKLRFQGGSIAQDIGAPDERQHANYVGRLILNKGFPVLGDPNSDPYENYQAHQPPLFYLVATGWSKVTGISDVADPSQGVRLRFLNALIGATCVIGCFFLGFWATGRSAIGIGAAAFAALLPMNVALSGAISNDPLLFSLCTWALAVMARAAKFGWCWGVTIRLGLLVGLALLTKTTALALLLTIPAYYLVWKKSHSEPKLPIYIGTSVLIAILTALPWWMRNQSLYGDPLAMNAFNAAFTGSPQASMFIQELGAGAYWTQWVSWWTMRSFIGTFGYMDIFMPMWAYWLGWIALGILALVGLSKPKVAAEPAQTPIWPLGVFALIVALLFVRFNMQYFQGQARYLLPAIGPISLLIGLGAQKMGKNHWIAIAVLAGLFLTLDIVALQTLKSEFPLRIQPPIIP